MKYCDDLTWHGGRCLVRIVLTGTVFKSDSKILGGQGPHQSLD